MAEMKKEEHYAKAVERNLPREFDWTTKSTVDYSVRFNSSTEFPLDYVSQPKAVTMSAYVNTIRRGIGSNFGA